MTQGRTVERSVDAPGPSTRVPGETGIWVLIFGDLLLFGVFFTTFTFYRGREPAVFAQGQRLLDVDLGVINTLLLLTGSLFVVTGVRSVRRGSGRPAVLLFAGAWMSGALFGMDKYLEYSEKIAMGITPMTDDFFMYYYILTGLHMFHVLIGMAMLTYMIVQARKPRITKSTLRYLEGGGVFWHLVDLLWVVLFPLLYLVRT